MVRRPAFGLIRHLVHRPDQIHPVFLLIYSGYSSHTFLLVIAAKKMPAAANYTADDAEHSDTVGASERQPGEVLHVGRDERRAILERLHQFVSDTTGEYPDGLTVGDIVHTEKGDHLSDGSPQQQEERGHHQTDMETK